MRILKFFLCSLALLAAGALAAQNPPQILIRERSVDFGTRSLAQGDTVVVFSYKNVGDSALVISRVAPTCSCVVPEFSTEPLQPGDSTTISARVTPNHTGNFTQVLVIVANTPENIHRLVVRGKITD